MSAITGMPSAALPELLRTQLQAQCEIDTDFVFQRLANGRGPGGGRGSVAVDNNGLCWSTSSCKPRFRRSLPWAT